MDLTKRAPRSGRVRLGGYVILPRMLDKGRAQGIETRGPSDHGMIDSIYFRDPNGYVIELCARKPGHDAMMDPRRNGARAKLQRWTADKASGTGAT